MPSWVTASGLVIKTTQQILTELADKQHADIDANLNTEPDEPLGQLNGTFASQLREAWEVLAECYSAFDPDAAEGVPLEKTCAITGTNRHAATKGTVHCDCALTIGTTLLHGVHFANVTGDSTNRWTPAADFTEPTGGTSDVLFESENTGPIPAYAGTLETITTPVTGWSALTNALDATLGTNVDTEPELRIRREEELRATGQATCDAMRSDLLDVDNIRQAQVLENVTDAIDANGLPPHSIECLVDDGVPSTLTDDEIAQLIWDTKGAGVRTIGTSSGTALDGLGNQHTVYFSRPTTLNVYLELDINTNIVTGYAGETLLKEALAAKGLEKQLVGRDVIANVYRAVAMGFAGVIDVTALRLGFTASPSGTANLVIGVRSLAAIDTSRIVITATGITPP